MQNYRLTSDPVEKARECVKHLLDKNRFLFGKIIKDNQGRVHTISTVFIPSLILTHFPAHRKDFSNLLAVAQFLNSFSKESSREKRPS